MALDDQHPQPTHIEPDTNSDDGDDGWSIGDDTASMHSLTSSVLQYEYKNGRRYATYGSNQYILPNDEPECDRIDLLQHIFGMLFGGRLVFSPLSSPKRILDVGTGTGTWALDVAMMYPDAQVIGTDISPHQPSLLPANLFFEINDAELEWDFHNKFDLVHVQGLNGAIRDWPSLIKQAYQNIIPGGFLEVKETDVYASCDDDSIPANSSLRQWEAQCIRACSLIGQSLTAPEQVKQWMEEAGFVDVEERQFYLPMNTWPKDPELKAIGKFQNLQYREALSPYGLGLLVEVLGWSREAMELFLVGVRKDLMNRHIHAYHKVRIVIGRRPDDNHI